MGSNTIKNIWFLWGHFSFRNKLLFIFTTLTAVLAAVLETQVLISFIPLINRLTSSTLQDSTEGSIQENIFMKDLESINTSTEDILNIFAILVIFSALIRLTFLYLASRNAADIGSNLSKLCFKSIIYRPYIDQIETDTSKTIEMISGNVARTINIIIAVSVLISSTFLSSAIIISLIKVNRNITILISIIIGLSYALIYRFSRKELYRNGQIIKRSSESIIELGKETIYSIKEIIIRKLYKKYINQFEKIDISLRRKQAISKFIGLYPRYILEAIALILLTNISYQLGKSDVNSDVLPTIGVFALGFIRLLPAIQQIYKNLTTIKTFSSSIESLNRCLISDNYYKNENLLNSYFLPLHDLDLSKNIIVANNISYRYPRGKFNTFTNLNINLEKGKNYAIIGKSGSGKSTLVDLLLGILEPDKGEITYYGKNINDIATRNLLHNNVAYVPQEPIILNESIINNIVLNFDSEIDHNFLSDILRAVSLNEFVDINGLDYLCGEKGNNLSGGQKQRLALARALYSNKAILFLDEFSSALDSKTEDFILNRIKEYFEDKTIISITHKVRKLSEYDLIIDLDVSKDNN